MEHPPRRAGPEVDWLAKEELEALQPDKGRDGRRVLLVKAEGRAGRQGEGRRRVERGGTSRRADVRAGCDAGGRPVLKRQRCVAETGLS